MGTFFCLRFYFLWTWIVDHQTAALVFDYPGTSSKAVFVSTLAVAESLSMRVVK